MNPLSDEDTVDETAEADVDELEAKYFGPSTVPVRVEFGAMSHPGKVRPNNEDHYAVVRRRRSRDILLTNLPRGLLSKVHDDAFAFVVADGIGGAAFGEVASMLALHAGWDLTTRAFKWHFKITEAEAAEQIEQLKVYGQFIHRSLLEHAQEDPRLRGMGTTLTGALTIGADAFIAHVGDSRAYLFRSSGAWSSAGTRSATTTMSLERLTRDHTLAQQLVDAGQLSSVEEASRLMQNMLVNCLGGRDHEVVVETYHLRLADADRLLLCTDGLTDMVEEPEIARILQTHANPQEACQALVEIALDHGGKDNVTVVVARYEIPSV